MGQLKRWNFRRSFLLGFVVFLLIGCNVTESNFSQVQSNQDTSSAGERDPQPSKKRHIITDAEYKAHIAALEKKYKGRGFHVVLQKPFVVIGNESEERVKAWSQRTVKWAVDKLKSKYFQHDPDRIIDIWLLKDRKTYEKHCMDLLGEKPGTPYGFYRSDRRVLMMNIATGGGTLVHEIVHPFVERNFERCPSWFNEGLASLYEQSNEKNKQIVGLTNWRLNGLQKAIIDKRVPSFKKLCSTTTYQFYNEDDGTNYSQARYLCYYLQEKKLLKKFYDSFKKNVKKDPTGYKTLCKVLKKTDLTDFKKDWEKYVLRLRF